MPPKPDPNVATTTIRLPRALLDRIDQIAEQERRSRNATIIVLLEQATR